MLTNNTDIVAIQDKSLSCANALPNILQEALEYAESGIPVFPCNPDTKSPFTSNGFKSASTDCDTIEKWWRKWPTALIGMPTGHASGVFVLDIDVKRDVNGFKALSALEEQNSPLPSTLTVKTPSGGEHRYFKMPKPEFRLTISAGKLGAGLDTRGEGGYVIIPPSVNSDGKSYQFVNREVDFAELPQWIIDLLKKAGVKQVIPHTFVPSDSRSYGTVALKEIVGEMADTLTGQRNDTLEHINF